MRKVIFLAVGLSAATSFAALTVTEDPTNGVLSVLRDGRPVIAKIDVSAGEVPPELVKRSSVGLPDGGRVWNRWCERRDVRYRLEVAQRTDGAVEITLAGQMEGSSPYRTRVVHLDAAPGVLVGKPYKALAGNGRVWNPVEGVADEGVRKVGYRWYASEGLTFDMNPVGPTDYCMQYNQGVVHGVWTLAPYGESLKFVGGSVVSTPFGGYVGAKVVIREGTFEDYDKVHVMRDYQYAWHLRSKYHVAFASPKRGKDFQEGHVPFDEGRGCGWRDVPSVRPIIGSPSGVWYSCLAGKGKATYRFAGLTDGFYVVSVGAGNYTGEPNRFSVAVNGEPLLDDMRVGKRQARLVSRAFRVTGGVADVSLAGDWLVSHLAIQPVMGDQEDFSVRRGYWVTDGYEPGSIYRNVDYRAKVSLRVSDETYDLPVPGEEAAADWREPPAPVNVPDVGSPAYAWTRRARMGSILGNSATLGEYDDPDELEAGLVSEVDSNRYNVAMVSGMHSRHTYFRHIGRGVTAMGRIAAGLHRRGVKVIDHHDSTLLWNSDGGLRVLMTRLPEVAKSTADHLPSFQLCPVNPVFREKYYAYLRALVEKGVDGFQIDELEIVEHGCACAACRRRFHDETGWSLPMDETHPCFSDWRNELASHWHTWRVRTITNFFVELRERVRDIKPDLSLHMYTTHWGFNRSYPRYRATSDLFDQSRTINFFGTEVMANNPIASIRTLIPSRKAFNQFALATGVPIWAWFRSRSAEQNLVCWGLSEMCGQMAFLDHYPLGEGTGVPDYERFATSDRAFRRVGATPLAEIALVFSRASRDWNSGVSFEGELNGTAQELEALHVPYDIVSETHLDPKTLAKYRMLFLCGAECLSDVVVGQVKDFVRRGGVVQMVSIAGRCDEFGRKRAIAPFDGLTDRVVRCSTPWATPFCQSELAYPRVNAFNPDPEKEARFRDELRRMTRSACLWRTDAPDKVYTALWREGDGTLAIQFLNGTGGGWPANEKVGPDPRGPVFPPLERDVSLAVPFDGDVRVTVAAPGMDGERNLAAVRKGGEVSAVVPKDALRTYAIVRIRRK